MSSLEPACGACGHVFSVGDARHYPCWWGCSGEIRRLRRDHGVALCVDCLPDLFKRSFLGGGRPILSAADLPKTGEPLPPHVIARSYGGGNDADG